MRSIKFYLSSALLCLAVLLVLSSSACSLPSITFQEPVWVTDLPVTFTGRFYVVEHHTSGGKNFTCSTDTTGALTVDSKGGVAFTTQGGVFLIGADGQCIEQGKDQGWQVEGQVEQLSQPYLKFTTCSKGRYRAQGSAEHVVAQYQQNTQTGKLTGGVTCYDENIKPVSEFAFYLAATEPRK
jgi:hypothetical protein